MEDRPGTGRLFRSLHAQGAEEAIVALDPADLVTLRSVSLRDGGPTESAIDPGLDPDFEHLFAPVTPAPTSAEPASIPSPMSRSSADDHTGEQPVAAALAPETPPADTPLTGQAGSVDQRSARRARVEAAHTGIPAWAAVLTILGATLLIGVADVVVTGGLGWLTGIALVLSTGYAAAMVRPADGYWVIVSAPLAFLTTTVTVGQVTISGGSFLVRQGLLIPFTLGRNVVWIILATVLAAVIVAIRRRRLLTPEA